MKKQKLCKRLLLFLVIKQSNPIHPELLPDNFAVSTKLKLPDAIIAATAIFLGIPLLSADKHFEGIDELTFIRYEP